MRVTRQSGALLPGEFWGCRRRSPERRAAERLTTIHGRRQCGCFQRMPAAYGFANIQIDDYGRSNPPGTISLSSGDGKLKLGSGAAMLLRVS